MGERPCGADAIVFGVLAGVLYPDFNSPVRRAGLSPSQPRALLRADDGTVVSGIRTGAREH